MRTKATTALPEAQVKAEESNSVVVLLGDVGGTNIRLTLRRLNLTTRESEEVKPF